MTEKNPLSGVGSDGIRRHVRGRRRNIPIWRPFEQLSQRESESILNHLTRFMDRIERRPNQFGSGLVGESSNIREILLAAPNISAPLIPPSNNLNKAINQWTIDDVTQFVSSIDTYLIYAENFKEHLIDGVGLPYLTVKQMTEIFKMKLGPVLKLKMKLDELLIQEMRANDQCPFEDSRDMTGRNTLSGVIAGSDAVRRLMQGRHQNAEASVALSAADADMIAENRNAVAGILSSSLPEDSVLLSIQKNEPIQVVENDENLKDYCPYLGAMPPAILPTASELRNLASTSYSLPMTNYSNMQTNIATQNCWQYYPIPVGDTTSNIHGSNVEGPQLKTAGQSQSLGSCALPPTTSRSKPILTDKLIEEWNIEDVVRYISTIDICATYAQIFREEEIDGYVLSTLTIAELRKDLKMKLGPAKKLHIKLGQCKQQQQN